MRPYDARTRGAGSSTGTSGGATDDQPAPTALITPIEFSARTRFDELHALLVGAILAQLDFLDEQINGSLTQSRNS